VLLPLLLCRVCVTHELIQIRITCRAVQVVQIAIVGVVVVGVQIVGVGDAIAIGGIHTRSIL
jgi:hypothetical protein